MDEQHHSGVERLEERLYSRGTLTKRKRAVRHLKPKEYGLKSSWGDRSAAIEEGSERWRGFGPEQRRSSPLLKIFLGIAIIFFLGALAVSAYLFLGGTRVVSPGNVDITVTGPTTVDAGAEVPLQITVTNTNATVLRNADLLIEYPEGTRSPEDKNEPLSRVRESLGDIAPGASIQRIVRAVFLGEEGQRKEVIATIEYRIEGSNAIFFKEQPYEVAVGASPVSLVVSGVRETTAGQEIELTAELTSNSPTLLHDILVSVSYPPGFTFTGASPAQTFDTNIWRIGDFPPGTKRTITIRGTLVGENDTERVFRFIAGIAREDNNKEVGVPLSQTLSSVVVKRPFLAATLMAGGKTIGERRAVKSGERESMTVTWANNLPVVVRDVEIRVGFRGDAFDAASVSAADGFYRSTDRVIVWNQRTKPELASLEPGEKGEVSFALIPTSLPPGTNIPLRNAEIGVLVDVEGERINERDVPERILSTTATTLRIISDATTRAYALYSTGPFMNSGSLPPKANEETTYSVTWSVANPANDLGAVTVVGVLPPAVHFLGTIDPLGESLIYNEASGELAWNIGALKAGVGYGTSPREVSFQVGLTPSVSQVGTVPELVNNIRLRGTDRFAETVVSGTAAALTTEIRNDPAFREGDATVLK